MQMSQKSYLGYMIKILLIGLFTTNRSTQDNVRGITHTQACYDLCKSAISVCSFTRRGFCYCQHVLGSNSSLPLKCTNAITEMHLEVNNKNGWIYSTGRLAGILEVNVD